jgi:Ca2+-binding EF-hand superfamily protein
MKSERSRKRTLAALLAAGALTASGLEPAMAAPMKQEDITALFRKADANADGGVTRDELAAIEPALVPNFEKADANKDGKLSLREFGSLFG